MQRGYLEVLNEKGIRNSNYYRNRECVTAKWHLSLVAINHAKNVGARKRTQLFPLDTAESPAKDHRTTRCDMKRILLTLIIVSMNLQHIVLIRRC